MASIAISNKLGVKEFEKQYRDHLSGFHAWDQKEHAESWMLFPSNIGSRLAIDETELTNGELYTIVTNKAAHGKKGALLAMVEGTKAGDVSAVLWIPSARTVQQLYPFDLSRGMPKRTETNSAQNGDGVDFRDTAGWRIFRIMAEFVDGFQFLKDLKKEVTIFGSTRVPEGSRWYEEAREFGNLLAEAGFTVITGGGPGIMEAANRGAVEGKGESIGLNIQLPREQRMNAYVKRGMGFHYFFTRKVMLSASAQAYIFFPGGFGTMDEVTELVEMIQTKKMQRVPIILVGKEYWNGYLAWVEAAMLAGDHPFIDTEDLHIMHVVDSAGEAFAIVKETKERPYF